MSTQFSLNQLFELHKTPPGQRQWLQWAANTDPDSLRGNPQALQVLLNLQQTVKAMIESPLTQKNITATPAQGQGLNLPQPQGLTIRAAMDAQAYQSGRVPQQPPAQAVPQQRSRVQYFVQQNAAPAPQPQPQLIQAPNLNKVEARQSQAIVKRAGAKYYRLTGKRGTSGNPQARRLAADETPRVGDYQRVGDNWSVIAEAQPAKSQAANQLPVSPYTGRPSQIRAVVLKSVGEPQPALNQPQYAIDQQVKAAVMPTVEMAISPVTGKPSSLTATVRRSVGL